MRAHLCLLSLGVLTACTSKLTSTVSTTCAAGVAVSNGGGSWTCVAEKDLTVGSVASAADAGTADFADYAPSAQYADQVGLADSFAPGATWLIGPPGSVGSPGAALSLWGDGLSSLGYFVGTVSDLDRSASIDRPPSSPAVDVATTTLTLARTSLVQVRASGTMDGVNARAACNLELHLENPDQSGDVAIGGTLVGVTPNAPTSWVAFGEGEWDAGSVLVTVKLTNVDTQGGTCQNLTAADVHFATEIIHAR